jgi:hypothetical protein
MFSQLGAEGWELSTIQPGRFDPQGFYIFKRLKGTLVSTGASDNSTSISVPFPANVTSFDVGTGLLWVSLGQSQLATGLAFQSRPPVEKEGASPMLEPIGGFRKRRKS